MFQFVTFSIPNWHLYLAVRVKCMIDKWQIHVCNVKVTWVEVLQIMQLAVFAIVSELLYGMSCVSGKNENVIAEMLEIKFNRMYGM